MTYLGFISLPLGLIGLFLPQKWLYRAFVFWTLFSASSVLNVGEGDNGSAMQVWMWFGFLWLLRVMLDRLSTLSFSADRRILRPCLWLLAFLLAGIASLVMPLYINGKLEITSPLLFDGSQAPLYFSWHHVTQVLYLAFGVVIAICVAHRNLEESQRHDTERVILISAIFIAAWGVMQFVCNITGVKYPDAVFNNSGSPAGLGFLSQLDDVGVSRISSVTLEPSVLAQNLAVLLPLTLPAWMGKRPVLSVAYDRLSTILLFAVLILSTSSTGYLGLFILVFLLLGVLVRTGAISLSRAALAVTAVSVVAVGMAAAIVASVPVVRDVVNSTLLDKAATYSGLERVMTIQLAYGYFEKFPLLGIGWGSAVSHDMVVLLLSNVGIIGALIFFGAMWCVVHSSWRSMESLESSASLSRVTWFLSLTVFLCTGLFSGFPLSLGSFWLVIGMAIATSWKPASSKPVREAELALRPA